MLKPCPPPPSPQFSFLGLLCRLDTGTCPVFQALMSLSCSLPPRGSSLPVPLVSPAPLCPGPRLPVVGGWLRAARVTGTVAPCNGSRSVLRTPPRAPGCCGCSCMGRRPGGQHLPNPPTTPWLFTGALPLPICWAHPGLVLCTGPQGHGMHPFHPRSSCLRDCHPSPRVALEPCTIRGAMQWPLLIRCGV